MAVEDALYGLDIIRARRPEDLRFVDYLEGRQSQYLSMPAKFRQAWAEVIDRHAVNMCRPVVFSKVNRLNVQSWEGDEAANTLWNIEGASQYQNEVYADAATTGDGYMLVWPARTMDGPLKWHPLRSDEAVVVYSDDDPDIVDYGVKVWLVESRGRARESRYRINVYYPDRVERYVTALIGTSGTGLVRDRSADINRIITDAQLIPYTDDGLDSVIPHNLPGVPLVHFRNNRGLDRRYGRSDLSDVLPLQDALNMASLNALVASEMYGLPLRVLLGFELTDDDGDGVPDNLPKPDPRADRFLAFPGTQTRVEQLSPADLTQLVGIMGTYVSQIAAVAQRPSHVFLREGMSMPSGESLRVAERPLIADVLTQQQVFTPAWTEVMRLTGIEATPLWADPNLVDMAEQWEIVRRKVDVGYPLRQALIDTGMESDVVDDILATTGTVGQLALQAFRNGDDPAAVVRG